MVVLLQQMVDARKEQEHQIALVSLLQEEEHLQAIMAVRNLLLAPALATP